MIVLLILHSISVQLVYIKVSLETFFFSRQFSSVFKKSIANTYVSGKKGASDNS